MVNNTTTYFTISDLGLIFIPLHDRKLWIFSEALHHNLNYLIHSHSEQVSGTYTIA
jgi:hypothetical protein